MVHAVLQHAGAEVLDRSMHVAGEQAAEACLGHRMAVEVGPAPELAVERRRTVRKQPKVVGEEAMRAALVDREADLPRAADERRPALALH